MTVADRATLANMAPEYGATTGFFPIDARTLDFLRLTGRSDAEVELVEQYANEQQVVPHRRRRGAGIHQGPFPGFEHRQSRAWPDPNGLRTACPLKAAKGSFHEALRAPIAKRGFALADSDLGRTATIDGGRSERIGHGAVVIASITSCTNTSNPSVMLAGRTVGPKGRPEGAPRAAARQDQPVAPARAWFAITWLPRGLIGRWPSWASTTSASAA